MKQLWRDGTFPMAVAAFTLGVSLAGLLFSIAK